MTPIEDYLDPATPFGFLSPNHVGTPFTVRNQQWKSIQHYYQFRKAFSKTDREIIRNAPTPRDAHRLGQTVGRVANWSINKASVMQEAYECKVLQNPDYRKQLLATNELLFCSTFDDILWGRGTAGNGEKVFDNIVNKLRRDLVEHGQQQRYFAIVAEQLASRINANIAITQLANNSAIIGAYAEATVREFVRNSVLPLQVSTGGVVSFQTSVKPKDIPQIDTLIWHASPLPAIFEAGEFALIDVNCCLGILEIKRSMYRNVGKKMKPILERQHELTCWLDDWGLNRQTALGVICYKKRNQKPDSELSALLSEKKAVVLLEETNKGVEPNQAGIYQLINFLGILRQRAKANDGTNSVIVPD